MHGCQYCITQTCMVSIKQEIILNHTQLAPELFFLNFWLQLCVIKQIVGVVYATWVWFKYNITLSGMV